MNEWLKKTFEKLKTTWSNWGMPQKLILIGIVVTVIIAIIVLLSVSATPTQVRLISTPIKDETELRQITKRLDDEGISTTVGEGNVLYVDNEATRTRANAILLREDLIPKGTDPWAVFEINKFTVTDFERDINLRKAINTQIKNHIEALPDIDKAIVTITTPKDELFIENKEPVKASVTIIPKVGSDIATNRKKVEGIQNIIIFGVSGLTAENIVISDENGIVINDFAGMEDFDRIEKIKREQQLVQKQEEYYRAKVLNLLQQTFGADRVRTLNVKIEMDMSEKLVDTEEHFPFTQKADDPITPYDDSVIMPSIPLSTEKTTYEYKGTGFVPEGPAGAEGQTSPAYKDMQNMNGYAKQTHEIQNEAINKRSSQEKYSPKIEKISVSANIDGSWDYDYDEKGNAKLQPNGDLVVKYTEIPDSVLADVEALVKDAVGFDVARGDSVSIKNVPYDRRQQFKEESKAFKAKEQRDIIILWSLVGLAVLLIAFILFRLASREIERRRRIAEEKRQLEQQMLRDNAIRNAEEQNIEVSMSVEERKRLDLQENAINMAKEHPEDVAQLLRTWLKED